MDEEQEGLSVGTQGGDVVEGDQFVLSGDFRYATVNVKSAIQTSAEEIRPLHQMRAPPRDFTGRQPEISELLRAVRQRGTAICLRGMGGIGKTALALKLAAALEDDYPDAQIVVEMGGSGPTPLAPAQAMAQVVRAYHPEAKVPEDGRELANLYRSVLHGHRALVLLDDARDAEQVEPLLPPESCALIVTSRQHFALPGLHALTLRTMTREDAEALLLKIAPRIGDLAPILAEACGCLPLALRLAGTALAQRKTLSPAEYLHRLESEQARLELVEASLSLSYGLLPEKLQDRWRTLAVFPGTFHWTGAAATWGVPLDDKREADLEQTREDLGELVRYSLVEWDEEAERYRLHDLARVYAASRLDTDEGSQAERRHAAHYVRVLQVANVLYSQGGENVVRCLALFDAERHNAEAGQGWAAAHAAEDKGAADLCYRYPDAGWYYLALRLHSSEWIQWLEAAVTACQTLGDRGCEGHLGNLGNAYSALGEVGEAIDYYERALAIAQETREASTEGSPEWTDARRGEGTQLCNLGNAYRDLGEMGKAVDYSERALVIAQEIREASTEGSPEWTEARRAEGVDLGNLGNAYSDLGEVGEAIDYYERALAIAQEIADRRGEGYRLGNLGNAYRALGEVEKAIEYVEAALAIFEEIKSPGAEQARRLLEVLRQPVRKRWWQLWK